MEEPFNKNQQGVPEGKEQLKIKILFAEDREDVRILTVMMLEDLGYSVEAVDNGKKLLDRLATAQPGEFGLVITDKDMPNMDDGMEVLEKINSDNRFNKLPRILYSGTLTPEIEQRVKELGGFCLEKPSSFEKISEILKKALSNSTQ